jgi:hypothetical protein
MKNIPLQDKFDSLVQGLTELEPIAVALSQNAVHSQSPHIGAMVARVRGAIESAGWHVKALAALPEPAPAPAAAAQPSTSVPDAKAGTRAAS